MNGCRVNDQNARQLECMYVHRVYSSQACSYDDLCDGPWPEIRNFLLDLPCGSHIADVGCGNGKYLNVRNDIVVHGSDICNELSQFAQKRHKDVIRADNLRLPYRCGSMDAVISVGVLHHIASARRRLQCIMELSRILKPGGKMLIYVWAWEQKIRKFKAQDVLVPWSENISKESQDKFEGSPVNSARGEESSMDWYDSKKCSEGVLVHESNGCSNSPTSLVATANCVKVGRCSFSAGSLDLRNDESGPETRIGVKNGHCFGETTLKSPSFTNSVGEIFGAFKEKLRSFSLSNDKRKHKETDNYENGLAESNGLMEPCSRNGKIWPGFRNYSTDNSLHSNFAESYQKETWTDEQDLKAEHSFHRFYHVFRKEELLELVKQASDLRVACQYYDHGNWSIVAEKI